jgi:uncharacterized LabA/DUF88 family protein
VEWATIEEVDHVIIFSHDTDLSSVVEVIARLKGPKAVEAASWVFDGSQRPRLPGSR